MALNTPNQTTQHTIELAEQGKELNGPFHSIEELKTSLDNPTEAEIAAIDTSKIPRICGAPAPRNKAEFLALMAESERAFAEGKGIPAEQVFAKLNAKYRSKKQ